MADREPLMMHLRGIDPWNCRCAAWRCGFFAVFIHQRGPTTGAIVSEKLSCHGPDLLPKGSASHAIAVIQGFDGLLGKTRVRAHHLRTCLTGGRVRFAQIPGATGWG